MDDGITSVPSSSQAVNLLRKTQSVLFEEGKIRLHKIASNRLDVLSQFPYEDLEKNLKSIDLATEELPMQQSLGLAWDINSDELTFSLRVHDKPFTKRGLLSVVNSLFDRLGYIAPLLIHGRILSRETCEGNKDWYDALPDDREKEWFTWREALNSLTEIRIPRMFT